MMKSYRALSVAALFLTGVVMILGSAPATMPTMPTPNNAGGTSLTRVYQPLDFDKWASGMYPDKFFGKFVVVDGYYRKNPVGQYNITQNILFFVSDRSVANMQRDAMSAARQGRALAAGDMHLIPVSAPMSMRDTIYPLEDDQRVRVYGTVTNPYSRSVFHGGVVSSSLQVQAERIEVRR